MQKILSYSANFFSNLLARSDQRVVGSLTSKYCRQLLMMYMLLVLITVPKHAAAIDATKSIHILRLNINHAQVKACFEPARPLPCRPQHFRHISSFDVRDLTTLKCGCSLTLSTTEIPVKFEVKTLD